MTRPTTGSTATGIWVPCELVGAFGGPVRVTDADGTVITVSRARFGFCDVPGDGGRAVSRLAVLGRIVGQDEGGVNRVRFPDGGEGRFPVFADWQLEFVTWKTEVAGAAA